MSALVSVIHDRVVQTIYTMLKYIILHVCAVHEY